MNNRFLGKIYFDRSLSVYCVDLRGIFEPPSFSPVTPIPMGLLFGKIACLNTLKCCLVSQRNSNSMDLKHLLTNDPG